MQEMDKAALVARSKCYLQLGSTSLALQDAEDSLKENKEYHKGLYQKAEVLYSMGDFEHALMFYHRGHKIRPELHEFTLGIQKAKEAVNNSIGSKSLTVYNGVMRMPHYPHRGLAPPICSRDMHTK
jgi:tetratricopeptide (TPR) repeat protein